MKTFEHFKKEVAEKYGCDIFNELLYVAENDYNSNLPTGTQLINEAAELWGQFQREEGIRIGVAMGKACKQDNLIAKTWNDALHWAAENAIVEAIIGYKGIINYRVNNDSILSGLKSTDSNKEE